MTTVEIKTAGPDGTETVRARRLGVPGLVITCSRGLYDLTSGAWALSGREHTRARARTGQGQLARASERISSRRGSPETKRSLFS